MSGPLTDPRRIVRRHLRPVYGLGNDPVPNIDELALSIVGALTAAGRLLPEPLETREAWRARYLVPGVGWYTTADREDAAAAQRAAAFHRAQWGATECHIERRLTWPGPWVAVDPAEVIQSCPNCLDAHSEESGCMDESGVAVDPDTPKESP